MGDLSLFWPEAATLLSALVAFAANAFGACYRTVWRLSLLFAVVTLLVTATHLGAAGEPFFANIYHVDLFSQVLKLGLAVGLLLTLLISGELGSVRADARAELPIFLNLSALGMMMMVSATELLTLYVALELSAYGLYILAALHRDQRLGSEAAVKYLLIGAAASAFTLYGVSLLFGAAGSTYLVDVVAQPATPLLLLGVVLTLSGLLFKLAVFPFHAWAPDTYQGAPHQAAAFIGTVSKLAAVGVLVRLLALAHGGAGAGAGAEAIAAVATSAPLAPGPPTRPGALFDVLLVLSVASMTYGNLAALVQRDLKRLLGYSAIAHAGYVLIGLAAFSDTGAAAALFYALIYVLIAFCVFLVVCALGADGRNPTFADLAGLYRRSPLLALVLLVGLFGLAGIPPTPGFAGKWFLFSAAMERGLFWLVLVGAINATVSLYYYLRVLKEAYLTPPGERAAVPLKPPVILAAYAALGLLLLLGVAPGPLWELAQQAARLVFGG